MRSVCGLESEQIISDIENKLKRLDDTALDYDGDEVDDEYYE